VGLRKPLLQPDIPGHLLPQPFHHRRHLCVCECARLWLLRAACCVLRVLRRAIEPASAPFSSKPPTDVVMLFPIILAIIVVPFACLCLPCFLRLVVRFRAAETQHRGASRAAINSLPTVKFKCVGVWCNQINGPPPILPSLSHSYFHNIPHPLSHTPKSHPERTCSGRRRAAPCARFVWASTRRTRPCACSAARAPTTSTSRTCSLWEGSRKGPRKSVSHTSLSALLDPFVLYQNATGASTSGCGSTLSAPAAARACCRPRAPPDARHGPAARRTSVSARGSTGPP
jgi:hypothetical protein